MFPGLERIHRKEQGTVNDMEGLSAVQEKRRSIFEGMEGKL